jgi:hypothetical protein
LGVATAASHALRCGSCGGQKVTSDGGIAPTVTAGTTYTIVVDGYSSSQSGNFTLTVTPPP